MSGTLDQLLGRLVPSCDDEIGDWDGVLAAAGATAPAAPQARRRFGRRRLAVLALGLVLIAILFATPAFGLRDLIVDFIGGRTSVSFVKSEPAPAQIKRQFLELALGAPKGMAPQVLPAEARQITFRGAAGQKRILWVAPVRGGGFCSTVQGAGGGCITRKVEARVGPVAVEASYSIARGKPLRVRAVDGYVYSAKVATLTLEFQDHQSIPIPFVYVSSPIDAGFYFTGVPPDHQLTGHQPTEIVARDGEGRIVGVKHLQVATLPSKRPPRLRISTPKQRVLPVAPPVAPSAPIQRGTADGFSVAVGRDGSVQFTQIAHTPELTRLVGHSVSYNCFRLTTEFGLFTVLGRGDEGRFAPTAGFQLNGVGAPVDGCDIEGSGGHRWPDAHGSHAPVEIALTPRGRAFFADRAAARDLALFVRSGRMQKIRKESGTELIRDMKAAYGRALARSRIRYTLTPGGVTFTETSTTGKVFRVVVVHGRIARDNLAQYAFVH